MITMNGAKIGAAALVLALAALAAGARLGRRTASTCISRARSGASAACSASSTTRSCSAASRSTSRSARAVTASSASPSATWREPGGPGFPEGAIKSLADTYQVDDEPNDQGKIVKRPAILADHLPSPYKNEQEARSAQNGALPPDLSLIAKARGVESNAPFYRVP